MMVFTEGCKFLNLGALMAGLLCMLTIAASSVAFRNSEVRCVESERQALLKFKEGLVDTTNLLSSWTSGNEDCCRWRGVGCNNRTSHIIRLDLRPRITYGSDGFSYTPMGGELGDSLLELRYLNHLELSFNRFTKIPEFIGSLSKLTYLNLSSNSFSGPIPDQLGNLSRLHSLDLRYNYRMTTNNLEWLSRLSCLRILIMGDTDFTKAANWFQSIKSHPSLSTLYLSASEFPEVDLSSLSHINSSNSLAVLHLLKSTLHPSTLPLLLNISSKMVDLSFSHNKFKGPIPDSFENMPSLEHIDFSFNQFEGGIPKSMGSLCNLRTLNLVVNKLSGTTSDFLQSLAGCTKTSSLRELYLATNQFEGNFPDSIGHLSNLVVLHVAKNQLTGSLPESIGQLTSLKVLDVSFNFLNGIISEVHLLNLSKLLNLDLSFNSLSLNISCDWIPPFQLVSIAINSCKVGPRFPIWLQTQKNFSHLDISNSGISDAIPTWFWNLPSNLLYLNLSFNSISGEVSNLPLKFDSLPAVDLMSNLFYGPIPRFLSNTTVLNLSNNKFLGSLSFLCARKPNLVNFVDLSNNQLSGRLPDCWMYLKYLVVLNLENNVLSGIIPISMGSLRHIDTLRLRNNSFVGKLPSTLRNCSNLKLLDVGENELSGKISPWIWKGLKSLIVLRLRSNTFYGNIPPTVCHLPSLHILDLSLNNLSGAIPICLNNLTAMAQKTRSSTIVEYDFGYRDTVWYGDTPVIVNRISQYGDYASVIWKGLEQEYGKTLRLLKVIDLSSNQLTGEIPREVTSLLELVSLNLSRNMLTGIIPKDIGQMEMLESLDLSRNKLCGKLPRSLAGLSYLSYLDLSNNNLSGKIPSSTQLQSFNSSSYARNQDLCGLPLPNKCPGDETVPNSPNTGGSEIKFQEGGEWFDRSCLYAGLGTGFAVGFWGVHGPLLFIRSWRHAYFRFLNNMADWLYLIVALRVAKLRRRLQS